MYQAGIASDYQDLLNRLVAYLTGQGSAFGLSYSGAGNGSLANYSGGNASLPETFTLTALNANQFSVVGSGSGNIGTATTGAPFTTAQLSFLLVAGATPFQAGDVFQLSTAPAWRSETSSDGATLLIAPGNDGVTSAYVGIRPFGSDLGDYWNWRLGGFSSVDNTKAFAGQPNANTYPLLPLTNTPFAYWFIANGRRVIIVARIGSSYLSAYLGLIQAYSTPSAYPMPTAVGGSLAFAKNPSVADPAWRYSNTSGACRAFALPGSPLAGQLNLSPSASQLQLLKPNNTWAAFDAGQETADYLVSAPAPANLGASVWPYCGGMFNLHKNLDGSVPLLPIVLSDSSPAVYGKLDGVYAVSGYQNQAESVIVNGVARYLVLPNVFRSGPAEMFAVQLEGQ